MTPGETSLLVNFGAELEALLRVTRVLHDGGRGRGPRWRVRLGRELELLLTCALRRLTEEVKVQIEPRRRRWRKIEIEPGRRRRAKGKR